MQAFAINRGQAAVWLVGGNDAELLGWMPGPRSQGSRTPGNLLPW
jgi:hypothetical protein